MQKLLSETPCILQVVIKKKHIFIKIQLHHISTLLIKYHKNRIGKGDGLGKEKSWKLKDKKKIYSYIV